MVHALEEIHRLLKPKGFLIDIHPIAEHSTVEIHRNGEIELVGHLEVHQWCVDFREADNALAEIVQRGKFTIEQKGMFDTLTYYDSVEEMDTSLKESIYKYARDPDSVDRDLPQTDVLTARAGELLRAAGSGAKLVLHERDHIGRLRPI
jgi:hypothetical protein